MGASMRKLASWVWLTLAAGLSTCAPVPVLATGPASVAVGETASRTDHPREHAQRLQAALTRELGVIDGVRLAPTVRRAEWVVRGSVTRLDRETVAGERHVRCEVSLVVAEARGGSVRMMLQGRAGARGPEPTAHLERIALDAAVRGALRPLGRTLVALR